MLFIFFMHDLTVMMRRGENTFKTDRPSGVAVYCSAQLSFSPRLTSCPSVGHQSHHSVSFSITRTTHDQTNKQSHLKIRTFFFRLDLLLAVFLGAAADWVCASSPS